MEQIRDSLDAWSNFGTFSDTERPDPCHVLTFLEWELQRQHWDAFVSDRSQAAKNSPHLFWQQIASCRQLKRLCAETERKHNALIARQAERIDRAHPSILPNALAKEIREEAGTVQGEALRCHAVLLVLQDFHRREHGLWGASGYVSLEPTRKQKQRQWRTVRTKLSAITPAQWELLGVASPQLRKITALAEQFAQNPPIPASDLRIVLKGLKGTKKKAIEIVGPAILSPEPPTRGHRHDPESHESRLNIEIAVLHELLSLLLKAPAHQAGSFLPLWPALLSFLQHFNPSSVMPPSDQGGDSVKAQSRGLGRLKKKVRSATTLDREAVERSLNAYLSSAKALLRPS